MTVSNPCIKISSVESSQVARLSLVPLGWPLCVGNNTPPLPPRSWEEEGSDLGEHRLSLWSGLQAKSSRLRSRNLV